MSIYNLYLNLVWRNAMVERSRILVLSLLIVFSVSLFSVNFEYSTYIFRNFS